MQRFTKMTKNKNTKKSVIICPGGGFKFLAINQEGRELAEKLAYHGINAFVFYYKTPRNATIEPSDNPSSLVSCYEVDNGTQKQLLQLLGATTYYYVRRPLLCNGSTYGVVAEGAPPRRKRRSNRRTRRVYRNARKLHSVGVTSFM